MVVNEPARDCWSHPLPHGVGGVIVPGSERRGGTDDKGGRGSTEGVGALW